MDKIVKKKMSLIKKILLGILGLLGLFIGYLLVMIYIVSPIEDSYDQIKFEKLSTEFKRLYNEVLATSGDSIDWVYTQKCDSAGENLGGGGLRECRLTFTADIPTTEIHTVKELHDTYYPIIDQSDFLVAKSNVVTSFHSRKGDTVFIDNAYKSYNSNEIDGILCGYEIDILQTDYVSDGNDGAVGRSFTDGHPGIVTVIFECSGGAWQSWYNAIR